MFDYHVNKNINIQLFLTHKLFFYKKQREISIIIFFHIVQILEFRYFLWGQEN